ncbi:MAG: hypothetical protein IKU61_05635 [Clostridia bacterium]|nr:hypothetical protein [Clostridia bacterium]
MYKYFQKGQANSFIDKRTALLACSALLIFGAFIGCAVYRILGIGESELYDKLIERYFLALFYKCTSPLDVARVAADCITHELWLFVAVFLSGFTLFSAAVGAIAMLYRGVLFGFAVTMLQFSSRTGLWLDSIAYLAASFALCMLLAILSSEAVMFFYSQRTVTLKSGEAKHYVLKFLRICAIASADVLFMLFLIYVYI